MRISSYIEDSFQEFSGKYSLVLFSVGCNLNCPGCYNKKVHNQDNYDAYEIIESKINPLHEGIVFLGGEPTLWDDLPDIIKLSKLKGLEVKVFTNGLNYSMLEKIVADVDSFSIDLKTMGNEESILGRKYDNYFEEVKKAIEIVVEAGKHLEVRTTKWLGVDVDQIHDFMKANYPRVQHIMQEDFLKGNY